MRMLRCTHGIPKETIIRGELADALEAEYAERKPIQTWENESPYVGKITKKLYYENDIGT